MGGGGERRPLPLPGEVQPVGAPRVSPADVTGAAHRDLENGLVHASTLGRPVGLPVWTREAQ